MPTQSSPASTSLAEQAAQILSSSLMSQPIGVCVILLNADDQVLLGKRINSYGAGMYGLPGGRLERNEPLDQAVHREVAEETGLLLQEIHFIGVIREFQPDNGADFIHFVFGSRLAGEDGGQAAVPQLTEPEKCEGWEWHDLGSLPELLLPGHRAALAQYADEIQLTDLTTA